MTSAPSLPLAGQLQWRPGSAGAEWWGRRVAAHGLGTGPASYLLHSGDAAEPRLSPSCSPAPASCSLHAAEHLAPPRVRLDLCMLMPGTQAPFLFPMLQRECSWGKLVGSMQVRGRLGFLPHGVTVQPRILFSFLFSFIKENVTCSLPSDSLWGSLRTFNQAALKSSGI